jgi:hypothetical protein
VTVWIRATSNASTWVIAKKVCHRVIASISEQRFSSTNQVERVVLSALEKPVVEDKTSHQPNDSMRIDAQWSVWEPRGFTW